MKSKTPQTDSMRTANNVTVDDWIHLCSRLEVDLSNAKRLYAKLEDRGEDLISQGCNHGEPEWERAVIAFRNVAAP